MLIDEKVNKIIKELKENQVNFTMQDIAFHYNIILTYNNEKSYLTDCNNHPVIFIKHSNLNDEWLDFIFQFGRFITKQDDDKFSILFQMPQYEIEQFGLYTQQSIMNHFQVDYHSAHKRLRYLNEWYASESWCEA